MAIDIKNFNIWEGVYDSYQDTPSCGEGFDSDRWIDSSYEKTKSILKDINNISFDTSSLHIISSLLYAKHNSVSVLDFGGGMGNSFIKLTSALPNSDNVLFSIVDGSKTCKKGESLFKNDDRIEFLSKLPKNKRYDIIYISSSLQYIEDWKNLLITLLTNYNPKYFIFDDLPAGDIEKTYASIQNYYESKISCNFFKLDDIKKEMTKNNYNLTYQTNFKANILGAYENYPQNNFHTKYQIHNSKNLIFKK